MIEDLHNICAYILHSPFKFFIMPGKDNENQSRTDRPEADKASKQNAHIDRNEDMGDIDPEYRPEADKALRKNVGSNKRPDDVRTNSDSGSAKSE